MEQAADERTAGSIILRDIELLDRTVRYCTQQIEPELTAELGRFVEQWCANVGWNGNFDEHDFWVTPKHWQPEEERFIAWFQIAYEGDDESLKVAQLSGFGTGQLTLRFSFKTYPGGSHRAYSAFQRTPEFGSIAKELSSLGFVHEGKGLFSRPIILAPDALLLAWEMRDYSSAFVPLKEILGKVQEAVLHFDRLIDAANSSSSTQPQT